MLSQPGNCHVTFPSQTFTELLYDEKFQVEISKFLFKLHLVLQLSVFNYPFRPILKNGLLSHSTQKTNKFFYYQTSIMQCECIFKSVVYTPTYQQLPIHFQALNAIIPRTIDIALGVDYFCRKNVLLKTINHRGSGQAIIIVCYDQL